MPCDSGEVLRGDGPFTCDDPDRRDEADTRADDPDRVLSAEEAIARVAAAEAEAAEAEALAAAARAKARAARLRIAAAAAAGTESVPGSESRAESESVPPTAAGAQGSRGDTGPGAAGEPAPGRRARIGWPAIAAGIAVACACALLATSGYQVWHHRQEQNRQRNAAEFAAAARQIVVTLMSIDFDNAQRNVEHILDNATGSFKQDFEGAAEDFVKVAQDAKVNTDTAVKATAVESLTDDSAVVLVAAASTITNAAGATADPRSWRLSITLEREEGQIRVSKVEFVP